jgi:hypothetical protein
MTLHKLLVNKMGEHISDAMRNLLKDNDKYHEHMGRAKLCDELITLLSEETLRTEAITKAEAVAKKDISKGEISW